MNKLFGLLVLSLTLSFSAKAQSVEEKNVAAAAEMLRKAMIDGDKEALDKVTAAELSYGHSGGKIENKAEFLEAFASGKSNFDSIAISDQTIQIVDNTAIVRHKLVASTSDKGKEPAKPNLFILTVWIKKDGHWKMLARQAVKNTAAH